MSAFAALVRKDVTLYLTNRRALLMALVAPVLIGAFMGAVLGGAPAKPVAVPFAVVDLDRSAISQSVVAAISKDSAFAVQQLPRAQAIDLVRKGKLRAAAILPPGFGKQATEALFRPGFAKPQIELHFDPSQAVTLTLIKGLLTQYVMQAVTAAAFGGRYLHYRPCAGSRGERCKAGHQGARCPVEHVQEHRRGPAAKWRHRR